MAWVTFGHRLDLSRGRLCGESLGLARKSAIPPRSGNTDVASRPRRLASGKTLSLSHDVNCVSVELSWLMCRGCSAGRCVGFGNLTEVFPSEHVDAVLAKTGWCAPRPGSADAGVGRVAAADRTEPVALVRTPHRQATARLLAWRSWWRSASGNRGRRDESPLCREAPGQAAPPSPRAVVRARTPSDVRSTSGRGRAGAAVRILKPVRTARSSPLLRPAHPVRRAVRSCRVRDRR